MEIQTWVSIVTIVAAMAGFHAAMRREVKTEIGALRTELKDDFAGLRTELKGDIAGLRTELKGDIDPDKAYKACALSIDKYCSVAATLRGAGAGITWEVKVNP